MRTTLTLDPDVAERIRRATASGRLTLKQVVNDRLRVGFGIAPAPEATPFTVHPHASAYRPGVDRLKLNQLVDEAEAEAFPAGPRPRRGR